MQPANYDQQFDPQSIQNYSYYQQLNPEVVSSNQFHTEMVPNHQFNRQMMHSDPFRTSVQNHQCSSQVIINNQYNYPVMPSKSMVINNENTPALENNRFNFNTNVSIS